MAWTHDYLVRTTLANAGSAELIAEAKMADLSTTRFLRNFVALTSHTANYQVAFGSNFTTPTKLFLIESGGRTCTYSIGANNRHHLVAANGCAFLHGSVTSLFMSNNGNSTAQVEILLVR